MVQQEAVIVRNAIKRYQKELVFNGLNMTVSRGSIYGLLGASGCGKTTLLSCIVGIRYLDSGEVWVLGGNPGSKDSGIPGPQVGYMPQEISLIEEFTMSSALYYFGRINGLDNEEIETSQRFLSELLQLPPTNRLIKNMSGDQQRRISLAAAMIHKPELLILDEPTVGLDPILRENIWAYMIQITQEEGTTVLITTHYIEETKDANKIGLMRHGKMLTELTPQKLLERFQCSSLEETFLKLCKAQDNTASLNDAQEFKMEDIDSDVSYQNQNQYEQTKATLEYKPVSKRQVSRLRRFTALLTKNGNQFLRFYGGLVYAILFPIIQVSIFIVAIGKDPKGLKIAVVNDEVGNCDYNNFSNVWNDEITCHFSNLSCRFLHSFNDSIATQKYYDDIYEATYAVQNEKLNGLMYFSQNFSEALQIRMEDATSAKDSDLLASQIQVFLDMSEIYEEVMKDCKYSPKLANLPIRFEKPVYGTTDLNYADFIAPSFMLILIFSLANTVSTSLIIADRLEGIWNRSIVQGVKTDEILVSHILIQSIIIIIHTAMIMLLYFSIWELECKGSIFDIIILTFLMGFCGLMYGFVISIMWKDYIMANFTSIGSFVVLIFCSGCIWPIEGMPKELRWISYILPTTLPSISMRGIIYKGYSVFEQQVYIGFIIVVGWILFYFIVTIVSLRRKTL
ncbi:PREDICTED: ABC transporter G family member 20-like isoform X2 [Acromyrmex echinatior]|uniref:ABC transporter G family member 20-like isoform X2 n=1 Tax=Acromyrmex echinatior TaxID=103372 RepID=UPI000580E6AE|nr:PREDICTED: ABC transporter G family member 20-like isoform X2 [Acromyrmex echinatior]